MKLEKYKTRIAKEDDFASILHVQKNDGYEHSYYLDKERYDNLLDRGEVFYLLEYDMQSIVGFVSVDYEVRAKLRFFSVSKKHQGVGIAAKLLEIVRNEAKRKGYKSVYCYTETNSPLRAFLMHQGFKNVGYYKNRYRKGRDASILQLDF